MSYVNRKICENKTKEEIRHSIIVPIKTASFYVEIQNTIMTIIKVIQMSWAKMYGKDCWMTSKLKINGKYIIHLN